MLVLTRAATLAALILSVLAAMLIGPAPAFADDGITGGANFLRQGARVYELDAVGYGCSLFGRCAGATAKLDREGIPQYLSLRPGEGVGVACATGDLVQVRGFFDGPDELADGWAYRSDLRLPVLPAAC